MKIWKCSFPEINRENQSKLKVYTIMQVIYDNLITTILHQICDKIREWVKMKKTVLPAYVHSLA